MSAKHLSLGSRSRPAGKLVGAAGAAALAMGLVLGGPQVGLASADSGEETSRAPAVGSDPAPASAGRESPRLRAPGVARVRGAESTETGSARSTQVDQGVLDIPRSRGGGSAASSDWVARRDSLRTRVPRPTDQSTLRPVDAPPAAASGDTPLPGADRAPAPLVVPVSDTAIIPVVPAASSPGLARVVGANFKAPSVKAPSMVLPTKIAQLLDRAAARLASLPPNPLTQFAAGALLLVRRTLFPMIPTVTDGQVYGGYVLRDPENPPATGLSDEVIAAAQRIRAEAVEAEPEITRDMIDLANAHGGKMEGLDFRLKSEQSLARKIADRVVVSGKDAWTEAQKLSDVTRYTMTFPTGIYADSVLQTKVDLEQQGYQLRVKNYWQQGDPYQGINVALTAPTGQKIELQFHTPESLAVKEGDLHKLYEIFRESQDNDERWRIYLEMNAIAMTIPMPAYQVLEINALEFQPFEILQPASGYEDITVITLLTAA